MKEQPLNDFTTLGLNETLLQALTDAGYTQPTPIQAKAIPPLILGRDLVGIAQTGTGKTAAFALPILHRLAADPTPAPRKGCRVLVLSPTRELASQIAENFRAYGKHMNVSIATVFGGVSHRPQINALNRGVDVLIATPGRLLDHMSTGNANIGRTEILVLDEADQMLDLGFLRPIRQIIGKLPKVRQTLLFSATMPEQIARLAKDFLHNPERISVAPVSSTAERVSQRVIHIDAAQKRHLLAKLFAESDQDMSRTLVFTRTKHGADRLAKHLQATGITVAAIHGNKSQPQRERALAAFSDAKIQVLVATDIAARGIDIDAVSHVVNYELPEVPEAYVHRIGRTARAGASGSAISFCDHSELKYLRGIERLTRQKIASETYRGGEVVSDGVQGGYDPVAGENAEREARAKPRRNRPSSHRGQRGGERSDRAPVADARSGERNEQGRPSKKPRRGQGGERAERVPATAEARPAGEHRAAGPRRKPAKPHHRGQGHRSEGDRSEGDRDRTDRNSNSKGQRASEPRAVRDGAPARTNAAKPNAAKPNTGKSSKPRANGAGKPNGHTATGARKASDGNAPRPNPNGNRSRRNNRDRAAAV